MNFLLIIISLFLGYMQGLKHRKRKSKKELHLLKEEIKDLKSTLREEQRKNRLSMFDVNKKIKGDQSMLEEKLVEYFSKHNSEIDCRKVETLVYYIIDKWENDFIHREAQINVADVNYIYNKFKDIDKSMMRTVTVKIKCIRDSRLHVVSVRDIFPYVIQVLEEINIEKYDISYGEFINAIRNASNILYG